jgi:O-antigen/teichoic acid export membrane protein
MARVPLPQGAIAVGVGLVLAGLSQYGFLAIAAHALGKTRYAPLATFWALLFVCAPGFFLPLEQEVGRALAARRARGEGGRPLVERAAVAGGSLAAGLIMAVLLAFSPLTSHLFGGDGGFIWALAIGFAIFSVQFLARGTFAGNGRFAPYGSLLAIEGALRVLLSLALALAAVRVAGLYGLVLVGGSVIAVAVVVAGQRGLLRPGPPASWSELSSALGFLLLASVMTQFLLSIGTVAVQILASPGQQAAAGQFLSSRIVAYVPIFLFQAVQAALLPKLSALAARGHHVEFRKVLVQLLLLVVALGLAATVGLTVFGPLITKVMFGGGLELGHLDFLLLAGSCSVFMVAQVLSQALISLSGYARVAVGWLAGALAFVVVTALGGDLFLRVELGLVAGSVATVAVMTALLVPLLRRHAARGHEAAELLAASSPVAET